MTQSNIVEVRKIMDLLQKGDKQTAQQEMERLIRQDKEAVLNWIEKNK